MKRVFALLALAGLSAAVGACGDDDDGDGNNEETTGDAGSDAGKDAGKDGSAATQVIDTDSLGSACTAASDCDGDGKVSCLTTLPSIPTVTGGYCTAECNATAECGTGGACPSGDAASNSQVAAVPGAVDTIVALLPKVCLEKCTVGDAGGQGSCTRAGYVCTPILSTLLPLVPEANRAMFGAIGIAVASFKDNYCLPGSSGGDAGSSALIVGGIDSGL